MESIIRLIDKLLHRCPHCHGAKYTEEEDDATMIKLWDTCPVCKGTGFEVQK